MYSIYSIIGAYAMSEQNTTSQLAALTRQLLQDRPRSKTYSIIALETGLSEAWLDDFNRNTGRDFGVNRVESLYIYLSGKKLEL